MKRLAMVLCMAALGSPAVAQTEPEDEFKAAAERWIAHGTAGIRYVSPRGWRGTFKTNMKAGKTNFVGFSGPDSMCYEHGTRTTVAYRAPELVFDFHMPVKGCTPPQYRFNPVTGQGKIFHSADGGKTWGQMTSNYSLTLVK